jgi:autotransporter-associated beta strand protein
MKIRIFIASLMAALFASAASHAQTFTWTNGSTNGIWDTVSSNWDDGIGDNIWQSTAAEFGTGTLTPGTVTITTGGVTATSLTFDTVGYTIAGGTLTLAGADTITTNANATISSAISGSLIKAGSGTLTLSGSSVVGDATINAGVLDVTGQIYDGNAWHNAHNVTVNSGGTLRLHSWGFTVPGGLNGVSTSALAVNGGTIEMATNANTWWNATGIRIGASGATLLVDSSVTWAVGANTYTASCQSVTNNSSLTLDGAGTGNMYMAILGTGSVTKNGSGTWLLNSFKDGGTTANSYTGATTINSGTLQLAAAGAISASTLVDIKAGATLATTAQSLTMLGTQTFKFTINGTTGLTGMLVAGVLDITTGVVDFASTGSLTADHYVIASYTSLTGSAFSSVLDLPTGYTLNYTYGVGSKEIALVQSVPEPSTWMTLLGGLGMLTIFRRRRA